MIKGITPVIALVLLIIIVITITTFSFVYFQSAITKTGESAQEKQETQLRSATTCIRGESITGNIIYIRNCGETDIDTTTIAVYANNSLVQIQQGQGTIPAGEIKGIVVDFGSLPAGNYDIKITSEGLFSIIRNVQLETGIPAVTLYSPDNNYRFPAGTTTVDVDCGSSDDDGISIEVYTGKATESLSLQAVCSDDDDACDNDPTANSVRTIFTQAVADGEEWKWNCKGIDGTGKEGWGVERRFFIDSSSASLTVALLEPINGTIFTGPVDINFSCSAAAGSGTITALELWSDITGIWQMNYQDPDPEDGFLAATISGVSAGEYRWNCRAQDSEQQAWHESDFSFTVSQNLPVNQKDMARYSQKEVFMTSDTTWRDVLSLVPVAVWTTPDNSITKYPVLIYHQEGSAIDVDSSIHFLQLYAASNLTHVGTPTTELTTLLISDSGAGQYAIQQNPNGYLGPGLMAEQIKQITANDYYSYWINFESVVLVDYNNYAAGLTASTYASYINAPIIFANRFFPPPLGVITGKDVVIVGNIDAATLNFVNTNARSVVIFSTDEMQQHYAFITSTDKALFVNDKDITHFLPKKFKPEKTSQTLVQQFAKNSLAAPILASARHEALFNVSFAMLPAEDNETSYQEVTDAAYMTDAIITEKINNYVINPKYLTIVAMPRSIPDSVFSAPGDWRQERDNAYGRDPDETNPGTKTSIAAAATDNAVSAVWIDSKNNENELYYTKFDSNGAQTINATRLTYNRNLSYQTSISADSSGNFHILFSQNTYNSEIFYTKLDNGTLAIKEKQITSTANASQEPYAAIDSLGRISLVWAEYANNNWEVYFTKLNGTGSKLIPDKRITYNMNESRMPAAITDGSYTHVIWLDSRDRMPGESGYKIFYAKIDAFGNKAVNDTAITSVNAALGISRPSITKDFQGNLHVVWVDRRETGYNKIYYAKIDNNGTKFVEDKRISDSISSNSPQVFAEGNVLHVTWSGNNEIFYKQLDLNGTTILDDVSVTENDGFTSSSPAAAMLQGVHVFWIDQMDGNTEIYYAKLDNNGNKIVPDKRLTNYRRVFTLGTGRIYGLSTSDVSSYIGRSLFYDNIINDIYSPAYFSGIGVASSFQNACTDALRVKDNLTNGGYNATCYTHEGYDENETGCNIPGCVHKTGPDSGEFDKYYKKQYLYFADHGWHDRWGMTLTSSPGSDYMRWMDLSFGAGLACSTGLFWWEYENYTFSHMFLRKGGIAYMGAVSTAYSSSLPCAKKTMQIATNQTRLSVGEINKAAVEQCGSAYDLYYTMFGDPVLVPRFKEVNWG